jgi:F-type H+-transporting ATPase subunit b
MDLVNPGFGLVFWTVITFAFLFIILRNFAWRPILKSLDQREEGIKEALDAAQEAKKEMQSLKADNEKMKQEARQERDAMLKEAQQMKKQIISEASEEAAKKAENIISKAQSAIESEKKAALDDLRKQVARYSVEISEKVLQQELKDKKEQEKLVSKYLDDVKLN